MRRKDIKIKGVYAGCIIALCTLVFALFVGYAHFFGPSYQAELIEHIVVEPTDSLYTLAHELEERRLIVSAFAFQVAYRATKGETLPVPGAYELSPNMDVWSVAKSLQATPHFAWIHIPVGVRTEQVQKLLVSSLLWDEEQVKQFESIKSASSTLALDGFFTPGVYLIETKTPPQVAMRMFYDRTKKEFELLKKESSTRDVSLYDALVIASLIQKEAAGAHDANLVSGIIWNRLDTNMALQIDATLQYAKGKEGRWWPVPLSEDKYIDSPYNTYKHAGLPPGPISNASRASLAAALNPMKTACLFYIHDPFARIHCAPTYTGHLANINAHLK
jgi:UPF0755 protein